LRELANQAEAAYIRPLPRGFLVLEAEQRASSSEAVMASASRKLSSGDYKGALAIYDELYATSPNDVRIMMGRAIALQKSGRADEALMAYEQVLNFQPSNLDALTNMIGLLAQQNPSLASSKLEALRKTYPANAKIAAQYGVAQSKLGNLQVALDAFSQAIKIEGGNAYYNYSRAVVLDKMGRRSEAAAEYRAALDLNRAGRTSQAIPVEAIQNRLAVL
jgi:Flp pilus assembly protein TadD